MTQPSLFTRWKRKLVTTGLVVAGLVAAFIYHTEDPTFLNRRKLELTDTFTQTQQELVLEKEFGIEYYGPKDMEIIEPLRANLGNIAIKTPELTRHLCAIYYHDVTVCDSYLVKSFLDYDGKARHSSNSIELCNPGSNTLIHELAHVAHFNASDSFKRAFRELHQANFGRDLQPRTDGLFRDLAPTWNDGTVGPRHGFVRPYGAKNEFEALATYVEASRSPFEWMEGEYQDSRYFETLTLLQQHGFVSEEELRMIKIALRANNPQLFKDRLLAATENLPRPRLVSDRCNYGNITEVYFDTPELELGFSGNMGGSGIYVRFRPTTGVEHYFSVYESDGSIVVSPLNKPLYHQVPEEAITRLRDQGYLALLDFREREKLRLNAGN